MRVVVEVLRTDDTSVMETHDTRRCIVARQLVDIGTRLRHNDPTVAALCTPFLAGHIWTGHANADQCAAIARSEVHND